MQTRCQHRQEVTAFLQNHLSSHRWELALPSSGRGQETYVAQSNDSRCFVKLGAHIPRYEAMASLDLTPAIIASGYLRDGTSVLVETYIEGRNPSWQDFRHLLPRMAAVVSKMHHSPALKRVLPAVASETYREVGLGAARRVQDKWALYRAQVPAVADYVDEALADVKQAIQGFAGCGLVASHNDICNSNWLIALDGRIYLVDLEAMCLDDPAHDMGSLLWWYYPPELRPRFLKRAGYQYDEAFRIGCGCAWRCTAWTFSCRGQGALTDSVLTRLQRSWLTSELWLLGEITHKGTVLEPESPNQKPQRSQLSTFRDSSLGSSGRVS
jgi:thiamine kinase-like enzyme